MPRQARLSDFLWQTHDARNDYRARLKTALLTVAVRIRQTEMEAGEKDRLTWARNVLHNADHHTDLIAPALLVAHEGLAAKIVADEEYEDDELLDAVAAMVDVFA